MSDLDAPKPSYRKVVAALAESEERYRVLVEGVRRYAIFMLDPKGKILTWNRGVHELLGHDREDVIGKSGAIVFNAADRAAGVFEKDLATAKRSGDSVAEHRNVRKDGTEVLVHETTTALHDLRGTLIGFAKVVRPRDATLVDPSADAVAVDLAKALATIQMEVEHRRRLEAELLTAVDGERERLGRDLHDDLSQRLTGIAMMTRTLSKESKGRSAADREKAEAIGELLTEAVGVARNLSRGLHPVTLSSQGLPAALEELAARVPHNVEFNWPRTERVKLESDVALHVYRIAEEAVGNALRHSKADKITIDLNPVSGRYIELMVSDNGEGFDVLGHASGMGLQNMKYRAGAIGGRITISSSPGHGTVVRCTVPLEHDRG